MINCPVAGRNMFFMPLALLYVIFSSFIQIKDYFQEAVKSLESNETSEMGSSLKKVWLKEIQSLTTQTNYDTLLVEMNF